MPDEPGVEEHPTVTLADKVGQKVAEHVTRAGAANAATETARRAASTLAIAESLRNDLKPAMAEMFGTIIEQLEDDDPTRKFYDMFMSPESVLNDAVVNIMGFAGMVIACISETGKVFFQPILNALWNERPRMPMSPADVANAVVQGYMTLEEGTEEASFSGLAGLPFQRMVEITGMPPSPQDLFSMFRRSIIEMGSKPTDRLTVTAGLAEGHTKDEWIEKFQKLAYVWPSPTDFVNAAIREQIPYGTAQEWAKNIVNIAQSALNATGVPSGGRRGREPQGGMRVHRDDLAVLVARFLPGEDLEDLEPGPGNGTDAASRSTAVKSPSVNGTRSRDAAKKDAADV